MDIKQVVAGTPFTAEQLCRVQTKLGMKVQVGTILARNGAFQHKFVVEKITFVGPHAEYPHMDVWAVAVRNLGVFFADNEFVLAANSQVKERYSLVQKGGQFNYDIGGYVPVIPVGDKKVPAPPCLHPHNATKEGRALRRAEIKAHKAEQKAKAIAAGFKDPTHMYSGGLYMEGTNGKVIPGDGVAIPPPPPRPPEAILADYLV